jgi:asparagine synthase (glutamine-hydrolysing)
LEGSEDLKHARIVADYLGTKHTEIVLTEQEFCDAIPEVIENIESYDTTTVRASIGNYLVAKYISQHSEAKVIFNGDGSDELAGGYLYMNYIEDAIEFDKETRRLLKDIHMFDVLRSDKSISSNGLEPRTPFLDRSFVEYYLSIPANIRFHKFYGQPEKFLIRNAFSVENFQNHKGLALLPDEILWRRKEAFSDGVSKQSRSLYTILQEFAEKQDVKMELFWPSDDPDILMPIYNNNHPETKEQIYYRYLFEKYYPKMGHLVPYFWMPRYITNATDASARTLDIYQNNDVNNNNLWQSNNDW